MSKNLIFMGVCIAMAMQSCGSDVEPESMRSQELAPQLSHLVVKFEDRIYETDVMISGDSVRYINKEYAELYRTKIANAKDYAAIISSDENGISYLEYFPSEKKLLEKYEVAKLDGVSEVENGVATRGGIIDLKLINDNSPIIAIGELYDDRNFKDTQLISYATTAWACFVPRLKDYGFNDKASSIKVYNKMKRDNSYTMHYIKQGEEYLGQQQRTYKGSELRPVLTCYHNSDFSGTAIYCVAPLSGSSDVHMDYNLKSIGWNDRISSIGWVIVDKFSLIDGDNPTYPKHPDC